MPIGLYLPTKQPWGYPKFWFWHHIFVSNYSYPLHYGTKKSFLLQGEAVISKHLKINEGAQTENNFCCMRTILFIWCITYLIYNFWKQRTLFEHIFPLLTNFNCPPSPPPCDLFWALSFALRSPDQLPGLSLPPLHFTQVHWIHHWKSLHFCREVFTAWGV